MTRSRLFLLVAWGLLALGSLVQVLRSDGSTDGAEAPPTDQLAFDAGDGDVGADEVGAGGGGAGGGADESEADTTTDVPVDERHGNLDRTAGRTIDDPASWDQAGVVLPTRSFVATVNGDGVAARSNPDTEVVDHWFPNPTQFGGPRAFLVVDQDSHPDWVKVSLPVMPNGQEGWIPRSEVTVAPVEHRALVDLGDRSVVVWDGDRVIVDTKAVTGKPSTPTPVGTFYVRDVIPQADATGGYGPYILALSGFSEVLDSFDGALPALAIHGTNKPEQIGTERSSGCVRIPNELISILADSVPLGTPVTVVA